MAEAPAVASAREQLTVFAAAYREAAGAAGGEVERRFRIGGYGVAIRFAGEALEPYLTPALNHLAEEFEGAPELVIHAWDSKTTGVRLPDAVYPLERHAENGMPGALAEDGILSAYLRPDSGLSMFDTASDEAYYWLPNALAVQFEDRSNTFRGILNWWMSLHGRQFVHAAAVGTEDGCVLIVGKSGSGKSTTALACLLAGMRYVGDDHFLLEPGQPPIAHSLYGSGKLFGHNIARLPALMPLVSNPDRLGFEKGVFFIADHFPGAIERRSPVRALLVPALTADAEPSIEPVPAAAVLAALAPSTLLQLASVRGESMRAMAGLVKAAPGYRLNLCSEVQRVPPLLVEFLASLGQAR